MAEGNDALRVLHEINEKLATLIGLVAHRAASAPAAGPARPSQDPPRVASDADLDGRYGDPEIRAKSPRDWTGDEQLGKRFSQCPAAYLELVADRLEYFASMKESMIDPDPDTLKKARFERLDASRARGWAARIRAGYKAPEGEASAAFGAYGAPF